MSTSAWLGRRRIDGRAGLGLGLWWWVASNSERIKHDEAAADWSRLPAPRVRRRTMEKLLATACLEHGGSGGGERERAALTWRTDRPGTQ
jgi:hypothetical protein